MKTVRGHRFAKRISLVVFPWPQPSERSSPGFSALIALLSPLASRVLIISGNLRMKFDYDNVSIVNVMAPIVKAANERPLSKILRLLFAQFSLSSKLVQLRKELDIIIFQGANGLLFLPCLVARLLGKKTILMVIGSDSKSLEAMYPGLWGRIFSVVAQAIFHINCFLANKIVLYSKSMIPSMGLQNYVNKISIAHEHFLDFDKFKMQKSLSERQNLVGYIGRLSKEKGVLNFMQAMPEVLKKEDAINFFIGGDGQLWDEIKGHLQQEDLNSKVNLAGYVPHNKISKYLNELRLLILPSHTEGLPMIILEAMACGTPVLATPVGAIPDIINDEETGFIMEDNSSECIAKNIIRALELPKFEEVAGNALAFVGKEFTYEKAAKRWREILFSP